MNSELSSDTLAWIAHVIRSHLGPNTVLILFGSYATKQANQKSDIDIAVRLDNPIPAAQLATIKEVFEESNLPQKVDVVDYHRVTPTFQQIIDKTGVLVP